MSSHDCLGGVKAKHNPWYMNTSIHVYCVYTYKYGLFVRITFKLFSKNDDDLCPACKGESE